MAINRVDFPTTPNPVSTDWAKLVNLTSKSFQNVNSPLQVDGSNIPQGATFQVGGVIYHADSDTAITGTSSDYVKLAPSGGGATLTPSFVANLTGVSWNKVYNGYYDVSGNLYVFDEALAVNNGGIPQAFTYFGIKSFLRTEVVDIGDWNMNTIGLITITMASLGIAASKIRRVYVAIRADSPFGGRTDPIEFGGQVWWSTNEITLSRDPGGNFDNTDYDDTAYNRGWVTIEYTP